MIHSSIGSQAQEQICILGKIDDFFKRFRIGSTLHRCGIRKRHGHSVHSLIKTIFTLPFIGKNFFRGIVINDEVSFDRSRSKKVELLCRVLDHTSGRFVKGFRMLTVCWSDGASCLPMDFALLSSAEAKKRLCESQKTMDKRCCAWQRRKEATIKATDHLCEMVERILSAGVKAKYLLMDSWFTMPATITALSSHIDVIGMIKKTPNILYGYNGHQMDLMTIYRNLKKRCGRASILASTIVTLKKGLHVKIVFVRDRRKKDWLALMSTDLELANEEVVRIYGKRWDIEVFFKMAKQHLKLAKEIQCRDYDALIAHTSIVFMRYMFLAYQCRIEADQRTSAICFMPAAKRWPIYPLLKRSTGY